MKPGVYIGKSNAEYHGGEGISKSGLDLISKSPMHYRHNRTSERKAPTPAQRIGTIAHALILEPDTFWSCYARPFEAPEGALATADEIKTRLSEIGEKTTGTKPVLADRLRAADPSSILLDDARTAYLAEIGEREIVAVDELAQAEAMRDAVLAHPKAAALLAPGSGVAELSCYWTDPETGVLCRCRPDYYRNDGVIVDLKTCLDASLSGFTGSIDKWRYNVQHPYYMDGVRQAIEQSGSDMTPPKAFLFIAVEKAAPFGVGVYLLDAVSVDIGRREYREDLRTYADCMSAGAWPGYGDKIQSISLPEWRLRQEAFENEEA